MKPLGSFDDKTHFYGRIWGLVAALLILSYPFVCMAIFGASIDWKLFASGASIIVLYCVVGAVETFTYTPMLGSGGTYLGFVTGNLSNLKVPCALNCMEQAGVEKGTEEAEIISTISIAVSSIVTMLILVLGVVLISFLTPVFENPTLAPAFDNVLPALFNEFIALLKETSVAGYIAVRDLTKASDGIRGITFNSVPLYLAAIIYLLFVIGITQIQKQVERRLAQSDRG